MDCFVSSIIGGAFDDVRGWLLVVALVLQGFLLGGSGIGEAGGRAGGADTMTYWIRRYTPACWIDMVSFRSDRMVFENEVAGIVDARLRAGELRCTLPASFCLVEQRSVGFEKQVGNIIGVRRDGTVVDTGLRDIE